MKLLSWIWSSLAGGEDSAAEPLPQAGPHGTGERVRVFISHRAENETIGFLEEHEDHFVFRYADEYRARPDAAPISAFPDLKQTYESKDLWPFFAVRFPPAHRPDVRELIETKKLSDKSTLYRLVELSPRTISNPYRFEMASGH